MYKRKRPRDPEIEVWHQNLCKKFMEIRLQQKRSRVDVAVGADLNPNYYGRIERGMTGGMHWNTFNGIRRSLGVKWVDIFGPDNSILYILEGTDKDDEYEQP